MNELEKWANQPETEEDGIQAEAIRRARIRFQYKHSVERAKLMQEKNEIANKKIDKTLQYDKLF